MPNPTRALALSLFVILSSALLSATATARGADVPQSGQATLRSPDGHLEVSVDTKGPLTYSITFDGRPVFAPSPLGLRFRGGITLGREARLLKADYSQSDSTWEDRFGKFRNVRDHYAQLHLFLLEAASNRHFELVFRAFDDGVGFRYILPATSTGPQGFILDEELTGFCFPADYPCFAGANENTGTKRNPVGYIGSQEANYLPTHLSGLPTDQVRVLPVLVHTPAAYVAIMEADLYDWAGMWLSRKPGSAQGPITLLARLAPRPDKQGLVKSSFPRKSPWRVLMIAREPGRLIESNLVLNLASPSVLKDISWVKPGMMSWDWWSNMTRPSTATYREFIQFASDMGWAYTLFDAGWSKPGDITQARANVDMGQLLAFAKEKHVRVWLWVRWSAMEKPDAAEKAFAQYQRWGIAGVKIDFMNRDDQEMVNWYERTVKMAAAHHLMIDFHGAFHPTGMNRTYPNQITREGVLGNEYNRGSYRVTPEHKTTLPFTRFLEGPGDFTPGGFINKQLGQFKPNVHPTEVQGTRCAELALFVCFDSPICCAADNPRNYRGQPGLDFLKIVPTVWDDTRVLDGAVGQHLVMARRNGNRWFLGALTNSQPRDISVKLDFLGPGQYTLHLWKDAPDSDVEGTHLQTEQRVVTSADTLPLHLAPAGGAVAMFEPIKR